jgi:IS1 family transposase
LVLAFVIGKREQDKANLLIEHLQAVSCGHIPFFTSDQWSQYPKALLNGYGIPEMIVNIPGKRGPKPKAKLLPPSNLLYAQVVKRRERGRVVEVTTKVVFGTEEAIQARLDASTVSETINTSFVERNNLTCRQCNGRLSRKVLSFSKDLTWMEKHLWLSLAYYHFVLPHPSLARPLPKPQPTRSTGSPKKWQPVTPAMAADITDHVWTMEELLSYRVPPDFRNELVGRLPRTYPFSDNRGTGTYAANASARTSESLTPFAGPVTASGTFAAPNKGRWIFVPTSGSSL